jgi:uncharacterized membrane protein HdeD (DUF308 family)
MFFPSQELDELSKKNLHENRSSFLFLGISSVVLGLFAVYFSLFSSLITIVGLGILLIIMGIFDGIQSFRLRTWKNFLLHLFLSVIYCVSGLLIMAHPLVSEINLTLLLAFFFIISGLVRIIFSLSHHTLHKGWNIFNGIITFILGLLIWQQWPVSGLWVFGTFMGINALLTGWTWIMLFLVARKLR